MTSSVWASHTVCSFTNIRSPVWLFQPQEHRANICICVNFQSAQWIKTCPFKHVLISFICSCSTLFWLWNTFADLMWRVWMFFPFRAWSVCIHSGLWINSSQQWSSNSCCTFLQCTAEGWKLCHWKQVNDQFLFHFCAILLYFYLHNQLINSDYYTFSRIQQKHLSIKTQHKLLS